MESMKSNHWDLYGLGHPHSVSSYFNSLIDIGLTETRLGKNIAATLSQ